MKNMVHRNKHREYLTTGPNKDRTVLIWHHRVSNLAPLGHYSKVRHTKHDETDKLRDVWISGSLALLLHSLSLPSKGKCWVIVS